MSRTGVFPEPPETRNRINNRKKDKPIVSSMDILAQQSEWVSFTDSHSPTSAFSSTSSWMERPVNADASWLPVAPPRNNRRTIESRDDEISSSMHSMEGSRHGGDRYSRTSLPPSGRNSRPPLSSRGSEDRDGHDVASVGSQDRSHRSDNSSRRINRPPPISALRSTTGSDRRTSKREPSPNRGRSRRSRSASPSPIVNHASDTGSRSRSNSRSDRGRSRTRSSSRAPVTGTQARISESESGSDNHQRSGRSRSSSRSGNRSASERIPVGDHHRRSGRSRSSSRSGNRSASERIPVTNSHTRTRSASRTRVSRERSRSRSSSRPPRQDPGVQVPHNNPLVRHNSSNSIGPGLPPRSSSRRHPSDDASAFSMDERIGREVSFGTTKPKSSRTTANSKRRQGGIMERLFGDQVLSRDVLNPGISSSLHSSSFHECIHSRVLLSATVYHNSATNLWITTINTNQKGVAMNQAAASKHLKAFSFACEREARESAIANAPPKMIPFDASPHCFVCNGKFAVFRRASHCRNCGVCICNSCCTSWPSKMIPETYNLKKESTVKVCNSCNNISMAFKRSLQSGDYEESIAIYGTGNINLRCPFPNEKSDKKGETVFPIHAAVEGGNLDLVRWLVDDHFCPIKTIRARNSKKGKKRGRGNDEPILTSTGRSVFSIAMAGLFIDIMRFLVVEKDVSVYETRDLKASLRSLEAVLLALPQRTDFQVSEANLPRIGHDVDDDYSETDSYSSNDNDNNSIHSDGKDVPDENRSKKEEKLSDACILCYENNIDCVITPCGHQICCLECSANLKLCPVCNAECEFIRIFKP